MMSVDESVEQLESEHRAAVAALEEASAACDRVNQAWVKFAGQAKQLAADQYAVEHAIVLALVDGRDPDMVPLVRHRAKKDMAELATKHLAQLRAEVNRSWLLADADRLIAESRVEDRLALDEQAELVNAVSSISSALGDAASIDIKDSKFQRRRDRSSALIGKALALQKQASEIPDHIEGQKQP